MLKNSTIFLIYVVAFLDLFSASMVTVCLPNYLKNQLGMSATFAGVVSSIYGFVQFFSSPIIGGWSDLHGYRRVMGVCLLLCVPAYTALMSYSWTIIIVSRFLAGCFKHTQNLSRTFLASFASETEKVRAFGRLNAMGNVGFIAGPAFSAWLLQNFDYWAVYLCIACTFLLNAILVLLFLQSNPEKVIINKNNNNKIGKKENSSFSSLFKGVDWNIHWDMFTTRFFLSFVVLLYRSSYNWMMSDKFHVDAVVQNYLSSYQGVVSFISSYYCNRMCDIYGGDTLKMYKHSIVMMLFSMFGLIFAPSFTIFAFFLAPLCLSTSIMRVVSLDLTTERCDKSDLGLVLGANASLISLARAVSPALGGGLHDIDPDFPAFFGLAFVIISYVITVKYTYPYQAHYKVVKS